jgi:hypothetical protein
MMVLMSIIASGVGHDLIFYRVVALIIKHDTIHTTHCLIAMISSTQNMSFSMKLLWDSVLLAHIKSIVEMSLIECTNTI